MFIFIMKWYLMFMHFLYKFNDVTIVNVQANE